MRLRWYIPIALLLPLRLNAAEPAVAARVATITINPKEVTVLHLRPEFESTIHMPEEVTSVILGSPDEFKAEHNEGEPEYVYVKPITKEAAQSNLLIATKSGQHVALELVSDGSSGTKDQEHPVDFLIEYRAARSFLISEDSGLFVLPNVPVKTSEHRLGEMSSGRGSPALSDLDEAFKQEEAINAPRWTKWDDKQIETSIGDTLQLGNKTLISYSILNSSNQAVEIVPPQIQIRGREATKKKKQGKGIISDQLEIRDYRLSMTRLEPGGRADGVVVFDRPNFKESTEKLYLQIAQADQVDRPILIHLPFTPPVAGDAK